ncbi:hypothetical protein [Thermus filiformis]|uniref:Uncharacterized protein n=1 Tax=Thermus filiformis TaxID=276 RepID=A0A0A2WQ81_THEFI|nr:hypothetical protein [Thermus filiformis]KGQ22326.1 hypothetical protein THFILI_00215 [Thermus filiformis]
MRELKAILPVQALPERDRRILEELERLMAALSPLGRLEAVRRGHLAIDRDLGAEAAWEDGLEEVAHA